MVRWGVEAVHASEPGACAQPRKPCNSHSTAPGHACSQLEPPPPPPSSAASAPVGRDDSTEASFSGSYCTPISASSAGSCGVSEDSSMASTHCSGRNKREGMQDAGEGAAGGRRQAAAAEGRVSPPISPPAARRPSVTHGRLPGLGVEPVAGLYGALGLGSGNAGLAAAAGLAPLLTIGLLAVDRLPRCLAGAIGPSGGWDMAPRAQGRWLHGAEFLKIASDPQ